eukprot:COSAG01_NODE_9766_length_2347_cov_31.477333_1_plen_31_part_10
MWLVPLPPRTSWLEAKCPKRSSSCCTLIRRR